MDVKDKVIVVTGGASGIGKGLCERFAKEGAKGIVVADLNGSGAAEVATQVGGVGTACDVTKEADIQAMVALAEKEYGPVDLMVSNAGVFFGDGEDGLATSASNKAWQTCWDIHVMAHVLAARAVLPSMIERKSGYFLHTSSAAGLLNQIGDAAYSTTKHAAIGFAEALAITHGDDGIGVSVLCPQGVATAMTVGMEESPQAGDGMLQPEDVAESVIAGLRDEVFLILPHPEVRTYMERKVADYDRWLGGMRRYRRKFS